MGEEDVDKVRNLSKVMFQFILAQGKSQPN